MLDLTASADMLEWRGTRFRIVETGRDGAPSILRFRAPPRSGPPMHIHHAEDEIFYVLSGALEFSVAGRRLRRGPGEAAVVPRGVEHTYTVLGDAPCDHVVILTPGGFEGYFAEMAERQLQVPDDLAEIDACALRHNCEVTGPPIVATL